MIKVWALEDDRMGSQGQVKGVSAALDKTRYQVTEIKLEHSPFAKLPNRLLGASLWGITKASRQKVDRDFPDLVISGSRRTAPIARWIKKKSKNKAKIIQLMHPGNSGLKDFDLIFVAKHDAHKKSLPNFRFISGSPHRVTPEALKEAKAKWQEEFKNLPKPLTAVIVGGAIKGKAFSIDNAVALGRAIREYVGRIGGSILLTTSRRTGDLPEEAILNYVNKFPNHQYLWGLTPGDNPLMGYLACADSIIVTGDSVSMTSEACGTGKPVFIFTGSNWLTSKHLRFVQSLYDESYAAPLGVDINFRPKRRLDPASFIASEIDGLFSDRLI